MGDDLIQKEWDSTEKFIRETGRPEKLFEVDRGKTALIIIDMQNAFIAPGSSIEVQGGRTLVPNINLLTEICRKARIPVIWVVSKFRSEAEWGLITTFEPDSPFGEDLKQPIDELKWDAHGAKLWHELKVADEKDYEVVKCRYSALINGSSNLERLLRTLGKDHLLVAGVATNACVAATVMDAMMLDFKVTVLSDATAAFTNFLQQAFLINLKMIFADVATTSDIIMEIENIL